jgi:hypothetical protein
MPAASILDDMTCVILQSTAPPRRGAVVAEPGERGRAVVDLFRVREGKLVEHWDASQDVPESAANDNTMF